MVENHFYVRGITGQYDTSQVLRILATKPSLIKNSILNYYN